jgi:hypothetical protein
VIEIQGLTSKQTQKWGRYIPLNRIPVPW